MSVLDRENVPVPLGFCPCAGSPHTDGDVVYLYSDLSVQAGIRARAWFLDAMQGEVNSVELQERIAGLWLSLDCVASWTFLDDEGAAIPVTAENIVRALPYGKGGREVADKADDLYVASVVTPLAQGLDALSRHGSTKSSPTATSRPTTSIRKRRKPSSTAITGRVHPGG